MEETKRNLLIDAARLACSVLVIAIHTRLWLDVDFCLGHFVSNVLARLAVPLFFIFSGFFLARHLGKIGDDHGAYLRSYVWNLIRIYLVWSFIYLPYDFLKLLSAGEGAGQAPGVYLHRLLIEGGHFHLWFFPALIYATLIVGYCYRQKKMRILYFLAAFFFAIGLAAEPYRAWVPITHFTQAVLDLVYEAGTSRSALFFALPFMVLGFAACRPGSKNDNHFLGFAFLLSIAALTMESFFLEGAVHSGGYNLYLSLLPAAFASFLLLRDNRLDLPQIDAKKMRDLSLLIYCAHGIFLIVAEEYLPATLHNSDRFAVCLILTAAFSFQILQWGKLRSLLV